VVVAPFGASLAPNSAICLNLAAILHVGTAGATDIDEADSPACPPAAEKYA